MRRKVKERIEERIDNQQCRHYWLIEVASGPKSRGVCKHCGETKYFLNAMPDLNTIKRKNNPLDLPEMSDVKLDRDSQS